MFMICCVTGHRSKGFPFKRDLDNVAYMEYEYLLHCEIEKLIYMGYTDFISGMAEGADMDFADDVLFWRSNLDDDIYHITLEAALPYPPKPAKTDSERLKMRDWVLQQCDYKHIVSPYYHKGCMQKRNCYMVDKSDLVLAVWNGKEEGGTWNTIKYARSKGKSIRYIMLNEMGKSLYISI